MAKYRTTQVAYWTDPYIGRLPALAKLLYLYLITSAHTSNLGYMEIQRELIAFETGLDLKDVNGYLAKFEQDKKIVCDEDKIWVVHFIQHQTSTSPRLLTGLQAEAKELTSHKILVAIAQRYPQLQIQLPNIPSDTLSIPSDTVSIPSKTVCIPSGERERELELELESEREVEVEREEEKEGEYKGGTIVPVVVPTTPEHVETPPCPQKQIIGLYAEILPELSQVKSWTTAREKMLVTRWREDKSRQSLDWWRQYFLKVKASNFLMGKVVSRDRAPFMADLEWIIRPNNMAKVLEDKYDNRRPRDIYTEAAEKGYDECTKDFMLDFSNTGEGDDSG